MLKVELNSLVKHFAATLFEVRGVYHYKIMPRKNDMQQKTSHPAFIFPLSGCTQYESDQIRCLLTPGMVIHVKANSLFKKTALGKRSSDCMMVFYEMYEEPGACSLTNANFSLHIEKNNSLEPILHQLYNVSKRPGNFAAFQMNTIFRRVLEETFMFMKNQAKLGTQELFNSVSDHIHTNYMHDISVRVLANQHGVTENRLFYVFQKFTGMGAGDYLRNYRLNQAKNLLMTTQLPIKIVGAQVGYPDALHFSRTFKKQFGVSPIAFKN